MIEINEVSSIVYREGYYNSREEFHRATGMPVFEFDEKDTFRKFFGVTYASLSEVRRVLLYHVNGYFAFIYHNRDIFRIMDDGEIIYKAPHTHIYFYDGGKHSVKAVEGWFKGLKDYEGREVNTFFEPAYSEKGCMRYLIHLDDKEKTAYDLSDVHVRSYTCSNRLFDYCSNSGSSVDRQLGVLISFAKREMNFIEACKKAPELFLKNYNNTKSIVSRVCFDLGIEDRFAYDESVMKEDIQYGHATKSEESVQVNENRV